LPKPDGSPALRGGGSAKSPRNANYRIEARLDAARHTIAGSETLTWTNTGASAVDKLPFHLYLTAFKNESSLFMRTSRGEMRGARATDTGWGWIQVDSLQIAGTEYAGKLVYPNLPDETVAEVPLAHPIAPGQTVEIAIKFTEQLPEVFARTGYKGEFHMVGQWFPKIGVRTGPPGAEQWECQPLHINTEFFADFGTSDVTLTVPSTEVVAATGVLVAAKEEPGGTRTLTYHAEDVHDFVWMADPYMKVYSGQAKVENGIVEVRVLARPEQEHFARRHLEAAIGSIEKFSAYFVPYPWPTMTVIDPPMDAAAGAGGMEYPTLVTTAGDHALMRPGIRLPEYVTIHEVGHNWFQGMLASNEPEETWLDEGVNEWADAHVMADLYGPHTSLVDYGGWQADAASLRWAIADDPSTLPSPIATAAYAFVDNATWAEQSYTNTMNALATLEHEVGTTKFMAAMKAYAKAFAFKHPTGRDLYATLEQQLGTDLGWYFDPVFQKVGGMKLAIKSASCAPAHAPRGVFGEGSARKTKSEQEAPDTGAYVCEVIVENTGVVHVPVEIELKFADGTAQRLLWDDKGTGNWQRFVVERSSKLVEVRLDPDRKILLQSPVTNAQRLVGDGAASLRAAARASWWTQSLMQLVGP
ncbi:MAG TPA: M1 family metallopeptidase, partial [Kofleriaceae bacterium]|nr:M1 family metallopeptidase [Kofleriaceae bacterium]